MKNIKTIVGASFLFIAVFAAGLLVVGKGSASAQQLAQPSNNQEANQSATYDYVAQSGDSYSLIARKAVQTYGIINKVNLSEAQIIYIETNLTQSADSPVLNKGQKVSIKVDDIKAWVEKAQKLTDAQEAAWNVYAQNANFNTDNVGQAS
jgi:hypothetical protein